MHTLNLIGLLLFLPSFTPQTISPLNLNNRAVQFFQEGNTEKSYQLLSLASKNANASIVVLKNLGWVATLLSKSTEAAFAWKQVYDTIRASIFSDSVSSKRAADDPKYRSILYESPFGKSLCHHESFSTNVAHSSKHGGEAVHLSRSTTDPVERAKLLYLDLVRRELTGFTGANSLTPILQQELSQRNINFDTSSRNKLTGVDEGNWDLYYASGGTTTGYVCPENAASCPATGNQAVHLLHIELLISDILAKNISGGFLECGVYRGGFIVMMQAILAINGQLEQDTPRQIIAADSFQGIPAGVELGVSMIDAIAQDTFTESDPSEFRKKDWLNRFVADESWLYENLRKLGLMKDNIILLKGFFNESLPRLKSELQRKNEKLALVHLDSDSYEAIAESLLYVYPLLSSGGFVIIDDMHLPGVQRAVHEFSGALEKGSISPIFPVGGDYIHSCGIFNDIPTFSELSSEKKDWKKDYDDVPDTNILHPRQQHLALSFTPYVGYFRKL